MTTLAPVRSSIVVGAVWVTLAITSGLYFSFPVFFVALVEDFGWSRAAHEIGRAHV